MILYEEAKYIVMQAGADRDSKVETLALQDVVGRICAENIYAPIIIQPFDNSAMDGFALKYCEKSGGGNVLKKSMIIAAGDPASHIEIKAGECAQIMTGAPIPKGVDSVVPIEQVIIDGDNITFPQDIKQGSHIRLAGEDFQKGQEVLKHGDIIKAQHIMPLSTLGVSEIKICVKPRVAFLATGKELIDDLSMDLKSGQIYNSNAHYAAVALKQMGADSIENITIKDDQKFFEDKINDLMEKDIDIIISSGAVSAGEFDFVKSGLENIGADILFHKVKIKPGKPNLFAILPNGTLYFGLPGNPVATAAGLRFFVEPCMRAMMGMGAEVIVKGRAVTSFKKRAGIRMFLKSYVLSSEDGVVNVELLDGQASFMVSPFLKMNCWADIKEDVEEVGVGDLIDLYPLYTNSMIL